MNIAVVFDQKLVSGGGYQQSLNTLKLLKKISKNKYNFIFFTTIFKNKIVFRREKIRLNYLKSSLILRILSHLRLNPKFQLLKIIIDLILPISLLEIELSYKKIDLVYFVSPSNLATDLRTINFIFTIWDLCHLDHPEFPEIRKNNQFEIRENLYNGVLKKAFRIIVESKEVKNLVNKNYNVNEKRISCISFEPNSNLDIDISPYFDDSQIEKKINELNYFLLYPAQYWPHKNHIYIIKAIKMLSEKSNIDFAVVFTGSNKGNLAYLKDFAKEINIENKIIFFNFVSNADLSRLYKKCTFVTMSSFFGPSNLPPLEGFKFGKPVLYPKIDSFIKQFNDAVIYIDLNNPNSMVEEIINLINNNYLLNLQVEKGYKFLKKKEENNRLKVLDQIFSSFYKIRICWKN